MQQTDRWQKILTDALQAPSPHNTQPWRVRIVDDHKAELFLDQRRLMPDEDPTGCFQVAAAGIFIEAVSLISANHGLRLETQLSEIKLDRPMIPVALLILVQDPSVAPDPTIAQRIATRRTSRLAHNGALIDPASADALAQLAQQYDQPFAYTADPTHIARMMARDTQAVFDDMTNHAYHSEFVGWLRTKRTAEQLRDGLSLKCMRMSRWDALMLRHMPWMLRTPVLSGMIAKHYQRVMGRTDHIGWFTGSFWDYPESIQAGRFLMRFWLALDAIGMGLHPLGNLATNPAAQAWFAEHVTAGQRPWLIFRFGKTNQPPASQRLPLREVLLD